MKGAKNLKNKFTSLLGRGLLFKFSKELHLRFWIPSNLIHFERIQFKSEFLEDIDPFCYHKEPCSFFAYTNGVEVVKIKNYIIVKPLEKFYLGY